MVRVEEHGQEVLRLVQDLLAIESHAGAVGREADVGQALLAWFHARKIDAEAYPVEGDRANIVARLQGAGHGGSLMLNGHLDTVPAGTMDDAFVPRTHDGVLWGRGACDMKGAIAAMAVAMARIAAGDRGSIAGELMFAGTVGEETGSIGVKRLIEAGIRADAAVVGEPTGLRIGIAHKGACFVRICLTGRGAHGSRPEDGVNAVSYGARVVAALEEKLRPQLREHTHPLLGRSTVNVGRLCGGTQPNIVAEECILDVDRRTLPGEDDAIGEIGTLVEDVCRGVEGLRWEIVEMEETAEVPHRALDTDCRSALVADAQSVCRELHLGAEPVGLPYWTDGGHLSASGIETIVWGPGNIAVAHGPREHVPIAELGIAAELYRRLALRRLEAD